MEQAKRQKNERQFKNWADTDSGGRVYWLEIEGRLGWKARYVKEVDSEENTTSFLQEISDHKGVLREIHEKYPVDKGHQKLDYHDN